MKTAFYINYDEKREWYMLCIKDTHFCMSCGKDLDFILKKIGEFVKRYKTKERMLRTLSELESKGLVTPKVFQQREDYYKSHGEDFKDLIDSTVDEAIREVREEMRANNPYKKLKKRTTSIPKDYTPVETCRKTVDFTPATPRKRKFPLRKVLAT